MINFIQSVGENTIYFLRKLGKAGIFLGVNLYYMVLPPYLPNRVIKQIYFIGVKTTLVIILTSLFAGMVLTLQVYYVLVNIGAESAVGSVTAVSLVRELGPVLTALMVTGRAGSALTAQIGVMRITDQIDAIDAMGLNPYKYLTIPNLIAGIICLPILTAIFIVVGIWGGHLVGTQMTGLSTGTYYGAIADSIMLKDLLLCLYKSLCFGLLIIWVSCYKGFYTGFKTYFGAEGVSRATTDAVVLSSVLVLIADYIITSILIFL